MRWRSSLNGSRSRKTEWMSSWTRRSDSDWRKGKTHSSQSNGSLWPVIRRTRHTGSLDLRLNLSPALRTLLLFFLPLLSCSNKVILIWDPRCTEPLPIILPFTIFSRSSVIVVLMAYTDGICSTRFMESCGHRRLSGRSNNRILISLYIHMYTNIPMYVAT